MRDRALEIFDDYPPRVRAQLLSKVIPMLVRGLWWQLWLRSSSTPVLIGAHCMIRNPQSLTVGRAFVAEDYVEIQALSKEGVTFGDNVTVGRYAMIRPSGYYGREIGEGMYMGNNSNVGPYCYIGCSGKVWIGENVLMGPRVTIIAENHNFQEIHVPIKHQGVTRQSVVIEDDCWLGTGSLILAGTHIGKGAIVAAGAVVTQNVPSQAIVGGVPARVLKHRTGHSLGEC